MTQLFKVKQNIHIHKEKSCNLKNKKTQGQAHWAVWTAFVNCDHWRGSTLAIYKTVLIIIPLNLQTITITWDVVKWRWGGSTWVKWLLWVTLGQPSTPSQPPIPPGLQRWRPLNGRPWLHMAVRFQVIVHGCGLSLWPTGCSLLCLWHKSATAAAVWGLWCYINVICRMPYSENSWAMGEREREIFIRIKQATKRDMPIKPAWCLLFSNISMI